MKGVRLVIFSVVLFCLGAVIGALVIFSIAQKEISSQLVEERAAKGDFDKVLGSLQEAFAKEGWVVEAKIDVHGVGPDGVAPKERTVAISVFSPGFAKEVSNTAPGLSAVVPGRIIVSESGGVVYVSRLNTALLVTMYSGEAADALKKLNEAEERIIGSATK